VVLTWVGVLGALVVVALSGMRFGDGGFDVPGTPSSKAMSVLDKKFPSDEDGPAPVLQLVVEARSGTFTDPQNLGLLTTALDEVRSFAGVVSVSDPLDPAYPYVSEDLTTAVSSIEVDRDADATAVTRDIEAVAEELRADGLTTEIGGSLASGVPEILGPSEIVGAALAFLVLLLTYGSLVAVGANMLGALVGVGVGIMGILAFSAITPVGSLTPILAVMPGLAVGIDYCLFIIARYRAELRGAAPVPDAIARAVGTAGSAVVFAGATVIIALLGLTVVGIMFLGERGAAAAVAVAVSMALTLVTALLSFMGPKALPRRERPRRPAGALDRPHSEAIAKPTGFFAGWAQVVTRHRLLSLLGGTGLLLALAVPVLSMQTTLNTPGGEDPQSTQRAAYHLVADKFGDGAQDPLVVLVQADDVAAELLTVTDRLSSLDNAAIVVPAGVSDDGDTALVTVMSDHGPLASETADLVRDIRAQDAVIPGVEILVTGGTAIGIDSDEQLKSALVLYIALIVGALPRPSDRAVPFDPPSSDRNARIFALPGGGAGGDCGRLPVGMAGRAHLGPAVYSAAEPASHRGDRHPVRPRHGLPGLPGVSNARSARARPLSPRSHPQRIPPLSVGRGGRGSHHGGGLRRVRCGPLVPDRLHRSRSDRRRGGGRVHRSDGARARNVGDAREDRVVDAAMAGSNPSLYRRRGRGPRPVSFRGCGAATGFRRRRAVSTACPVGVRQ
jgi:RND superfamily putative drug exporter